MLLFTSVFGELLERNINELAMEEYKKKDSKLKLINERDKSMARKEMSPNLTALSGHNYLVPGYLSSSRRHL